MSVERYNKLVEEVRRRREDVAKIQGQIESDNEQMAELQKRLREDGFASMKEVREKVKDLEAKIEERLAEAERLLA